MESETRCKLVGLLRMIAFNILSVMRGLARIKSSETKANKPTWTMAIEHTFLVTWIPTLDLTKFHAFE